jgi:hypothetical protein
MGGSARIFLLANSAFKIRVALNLGSSIVSIILPNVSAYVVYFHSNLTNPNSIYNTKILGIS